MLADSGINQYASMHPKEDNLLNIFSGGECGFNFLKIREAQNLDWAEDCIMQGLESEKAGDLPKALESYSNAAELDPLSK